MVKNDVLEENNRDECKYRRLTNLVETLLWNKETKGNLLLLLNSLLDYDSEKRWDAD